MATNLFVLKNYHKAKKKYQETSASKIAKAIQVLRQKATTKTLVKIQIRHKSQRPMRQTSNEKHCPTQHYLNGVLIRDVLK